MNYEFQSDVLAQNLRRLRRRIPNLTQQKLAKKINVGRSTLQSYESGRRVPPIWALVNLAECLGVTLEELIQPDITE